MPKTKRWASSEHSRVVSGVFPRSIRGGDEDNEGSILQNAAFGLTRVRLQSTRTLAKASARHLVRPSNKVGQLPGAGTDSANKKQNGDSAAARALARTPSVSQFYDKVSRLRVTTTGELLWLAFGLLDSIFLLLSAPLRLGFFFDPWNEPHRRTTWTLALTLFSTLDAIFCVLRIAASRETLTRLLHNSRFVNFLQTLERTRRETSIFRMFKASMMGDDVTLRSGRSAFSARGDRIAPFDAVPIRRSARAQKQTLRATWFGALTTLAYVVPWEAGCVLLNYNWMHLAGLPRYPYAVYNLPKQLHAILFTHLHESRLVQLLSFSTLAIAVYLFFVGLYLCHAAAAGYIFVAHWRCGLAFTHCEKLPLPQAWVLRDNLERGSTLRKYVRALYWACKTVTTLGQGDLVPTTHTETLYRIVVQLVSGLWATAILTAYSFYFSHKDTNMATNICTRQQQAAQFLQARKLSKELAIDVRTYFRYMDRTRSGVEEDLILSNLPTHYRIQCSHYVKYKCFRRVAIFKNRRGAFLRTVLNLLEHDFFAPSQVVLRPNEPEEMLIVAAGEIRVTDGAHTIKGRLTAGNAYAEYALFEDHLSTNRLVAETYCELWCLSKRAFKVALQKHFSKIMYASLLSRKLQPKTADLMARRNSFDDMEASARVLKLVGVGSTVKNKMVQKLTREATSAAEKVPAWRHPDSTFQFVWARARCALLLLLIAEVPHQMAFQRGFGLLNSASQPVFGTVPFSVQVADFALSLAIELFFYADLYLRARCFVRPALSRREQQAEDELSNVHAVAMISDQAQIFRHFLEHDSYWPDVVASLPIALAWDVVPKEWFTPRVVLFVRFFRALRLLRVRNMKQTLKTLMLDHGFAQYSRLLVYIAAGVVSAAHCAGCLFFLVADMDVFQGGLPADGVAPGGISTPECLERATLFGNCTWYMYDRSTFAIDAPYLRSLHWSLVLLSTVGYGDIVAFTTKECVAACVWIFVGANVCYFTGSALTSVSAQVTVLDAIRQDRVAEINLALTSMPTVSAATKSLLRSYYETKWKLNGSAVHDEELMAHLPRSLRRRVVRALYLDDVRRCALFVDASTPENAVLLQLLAQAARCEIFLRHTLVIREGHLATEFFLVQSGDAEKLLPALNASLPPPEAHSSPSRRAPRISIKMPPVGAKFAKQPSRGVFLKSTSSPSAIHTRSRAQLGTEVAGGASAPPPLRQFASLPKSSLMRTSIANRQSLWRIGVRSTPIKNLDGAIFVSVLRPGDCFGEESIAPSARREVYQVSVRAVSTIQVVVIRREDLLTLSTRFPQQFESILARRKQQATADDALLQKLRVNFFTKEKLSKWLGPTDSLLFEDTKRNKRLRRVLDPDTPFARWWHRAIGVVLTYNFYVIVFRVAFLPRPSPATMRCLTALDYCFDALLYADIYLKHQHLGFVEHGQKILDPALIRKRYREGRMVQDCLSMLPLYYHGDYLYMSAARVVRLLRSPQLLTLLNDIHSHIQQHFLKGSTVLLNVFALIKFILVFVSTAHYVGSLYYLLGRLQLASGLVTTSWVSADVILAQHPHDPFVHYMRAMYWCLSTFTVDCFGDIWARNFLEVCFAGATCVLGWIFIGQVIGRINSLIVTLNLEAKQRRERVEDFEQYARQRRIPAALRLRATQSLAYKSECRLELSVRDVFADLPRALRCQLFLEMYGAFVKDAELFQQLKRPQLEAIACALRVEIYLHGDLIYEAGRAGSTLYMMKAGLAEIFSPTTGVVFAALPPGALFGEFAFFIPGAIRLASARAVRSCQVLQLDKSQWNALWPRDVRVEIETHLVPLVKAKYAQVSTTYMNISKNLFTKHDKTAPETTVVLRVPVPRPMRFSRRFPSAPTQTPAASSAPALATSSDRAQATTAAASASHRRSSSVDTTGAKSRRKTVLGRSTSKLRQLMNELSGLQILLDGGEAELPAQTTTSSQTAAASSAAAAKCEAPVETEVAHHPHLLSRRGSSFPSTWRLSSTSDAVGSGVLRVPQQQVSLNAPLVHEGALSSDADDLAVTAYESPAAPEAFTGHDLGLSLASEARWVRHRKRLQGIATFYAGSLRIAEAVGRDPDTPSARRHSISVLPSYEDEVAARVHVTHAREGFNTYFPVRRHSIQGDRRELAAALLKIDDFESKMTVEVVQMSSVPLLELSRATPDVSERVRMNALPSSRQSRRFSSTRTMMMESPSLRSVDAFSSRRGSTAPAVEVSWWRSLLGGSQRQLRKVAPFVATSAAVRPQQDPRFQIWVPRASVPAMFLQNSAFRHCWNAVMLAITLYYLVVIPFRVGFLHTFLTDPAHVVAVEVWFLFEYLLTDALCVLDLVLQRNYFVFLRHGDVVSDRKELAAHYWSHGSLAIDALSIAPFELLAVVGVYATTHAASLGHPPQSLWHALSLFRINRFLRGVHLHALLDKVQRFLLYDLKVRAIWSRVLYLLRLALDFALGTHWVACLFYGASFLTFDETRPSWLTTPGMLLFEGCETLDDVARVPVSVAYLRSLHFSIGAITTVCYGDILPMNAAENVTTLAVIFLSVALFSMLSGGFFKLFEHELGKRAQYEERVAQVGHFMVFHQFPARTWKQMQVYFALSWQESKGMHEDEMLRGLTTTVRQEIALHVHANLIKHVKLFTHTDEQFARVVVAALKHELFVRNDVVIQRGDMGRSLYIIETGLISICVVRNLYATGAAGAGSAAERAEVHRSSVTEWMAQTPISLADAKRLAATGGGVVGEGGLSGQATGLGAHVKPRGRKVTQREEKFVKGPFDYFGERSLLFGTPRNATCIALCVCSLFVLTHDRFEEIMDEFPEYRAKCVRIWVMNKHMDK